ncbi:MAG: D-amino acid aminotransferase [Chromatiales bacterium]|jgi:D-alanine transaminase|nr:MAG: D-amino acid aminotransferase [Chromatiales bacterium]
MAAPLPTAWFNGTYMPIAEVRISPLDRAFLYGDAVYEVIPVFAGQSFLLEPHLTRLERSLRELRIRSPHNRAEWVTLIDGLIRKNGGGNLAVYLQVSRGADVARDHAFPGDHVPPTVFGMAMPISEPHPDRHGIRAITRQDQRWGRCDIKSTALLANILAREDASAAGAGEAILLRNGLLSEGSASSVIIVEKSALLRPPAGPEVLPGTTTDAVFALARQCGLRCGDEEISEKRLRGADEIWVAAATRGIAPVIELDGLPVGNGSPGPVWRQVAAAFEASKTGERAP